MKERKREDVLRISKILRGMRYRCKNKKYHDFHRYGGRGIKVCEEWDKNTDSFIEWSLSNGYSQDKSIDRIDVDGDYEPNNCRWVDMKTQQNNRGNNIVIEYDGDCRSLLGWSEITGIDVDLLQDRYHKGWDSKRILTTPKNSHRRKLTLNGITKDVAEWAKELNIPNETLIYRTDHGFSEYEIIHGRKQSTSTNPPRIFLEHNGKNQSIKDWASELGVNKGTLFTRYYKGWSTEEILYGNKKSKRTVYLEYGGKKLSLKEWSKIVGYHPDTLRNRMKKGYTTEEILYGKKENKQ